jgi:type VI secretion system protein ImpA
LIHELISRTGKTMADLIDFNALIAPVPGENPAGQPLPYSVRERLDKARLEPDPLEPSTAERRADWKGIIELASDALINTSKDLLLVVRLVEALTKKFDFAGLRDGSKLLRLVVENCWERMHPIPEEGEGMEVREGSFKWINDSMRGAKFPTSISNIPVIKARGEAFTYYDWKSAARLPEFEASIPAADPKKLKETHDDLVAAFAELKNLNRLLDEKLKEASPDLTSEENPSNIGQALKNYQDMVEEIMRRKGVGTSAAAGGGAVESADDGEGNVGAPLSAISTNRDALYRQLGQIADTLQRIEPHSPIPFLLKRAVRLGSLPFPELMRAIIRETGVLDELDRLLGLEPPKTG